MCDPVSIGLTLVAGAAVNQAEQSRKSASQAATQQRETIAAAEGERGRVEAEAAQSANARLAETQRRRRTQQSLMASGAPAASVAASPLSSAEPVTRSTTATQANMLQRGAPGAQFYV